MSGKKRRSYCPVTFALDLIGDKWSLLIVRDIMFRGRNSYGEFLDNGEGIATNILADRLKRLEAEGIIVRHRDPENGRKVVYRLTDKGWDLAPILCEMIRWGGKHDPDTAAPPEILRQLDTDPLAVVACLRAKAEGESSNN